MNERVRCWGLAVACCLPACCTSRADTFSADVTVDPSVSKGRIQRHVLGQNVEASDPKGIFGTESNPEVGRTGSGTWDPVRRRPDTALLARGKQAGIGMMRYPGGCLVHGYNWKKAIGPVGQRPGYEFGLDEFLSYCTLLGATPLMNVSDYSSTPQEAAELVEYLNAPATSEHPWAMKRKANGREKPYGVRFFEMGNESDHGNHELKPSAKWTGQQYADWYNDAVVRMKKVDPSIHCGVLTSTTFPKWEPTWNDVVLGATKANADFVVVHCYSVGLWGDDQMANLPMEWVGKAPLAAIDTFARRLQGFRHRVEKAIGKSVPIAVTEYNAMFVQEKPIPMRFSLAGALFSSGFLLHMLEPDSGIGMANYWQFANGYWGMVQGKEEQGVKEMPAFLLYRLIAGHLLEQRIETKVEGPMVEFRPPQRIGLVDSCFGPVASEGGVEGPNLLGTGSWVSNSPDARYSQKSANGNVRLEMTLSQGEIHAPFALVDGPGGAEFQVDFEARFVGSIKGATLGVSVIDRRGWDPYHSGMAIEGVHEAKTWRAFSGRFASLPGSNGCSLVTRAVAPNGEVKGTMEIRNIRVHVATPAHEPAFPAVQAFATKSADNKSCALILINRKPDQDGEIAVRLKGFHIEEATESKVVVIDLLSTNLEEAKVIGHFAGEELKDDQDGSIKVRVPRASATGLLLRVGAK